MFNVYFELDRLHTALINKGIDEDVAVRIVEKARSQIDATITEEGQAAMQTAIAEGVAKRSPEFINQLKLNRISLALDTDSGNMDFSEPALPMLPFLLQGAKPMKDGSGVYKVIPVGGEGGKPRPNVSTNIYDAWKKENAARIEASQAQYQKISPRGSKAQFRTATSKQSSQSQWVQPAKDKDFSEVVQGINKELTNSLEGRIRDILREFEEGF